MEPTKQNAEAMLTNAGEIETAVRARAPQEHPLYFATGLVYVLAGLLFDLGSGNSGGAAVAVAVIGLAIFAVMAATHVPYWRRYRRVRKRSTPKWLEWAFAAWGAAALFVLGILLSGTIDFAFTMGGIVGAVPSLLWAQQLRRTA